MKNKVLSIERMQHLKELGVSTDNASAVLMLYTENGEELGWNEVENHGKNKPLYEWYNDDTEIWESAYIRIYDAEMGNYDHSYRKECGTFALQDMLEMMPSVLYAWKDGEVLTTKTDSCDYKAYLILQKQRVGYVCEYRDMRYDMPIFQEYGDTSIEAAYYMICLLAEKKLLGKEENK